MHIVGVLTAVLYAILSTIDVEDCREKDSAAEFTVDKQEFVRPRWPYDMRPSARAEKYIRDAGP